MPTALSTALGRFRVVSLIEGLSYALLVFIAMPLKYGLDQPEMVRVIGMVHGLLFVAFCIALWLAWRERRWSVGQAAALFGASLVPLGALWIERRCGREAQQTSQKQLGKSQR